jgi:hypothetical protein
MIDPPGDARATHSVLIRRPERSRPKGGASRSGREDGSRPRSSIIT